MKKVAYITDTHIGARGASKTFREYFKTYFKEILFPHFKENKIDLIIHGGDFFDSRTSISLADIDYILNEFIPLVEEYGIPMKVIAGNHDTHYRNTNKINSLALLKSSSCIEVIDETVEVIETKNGKIVLCPWINSENHEDFVSEIKKHEGDNNTLVGHFDINGFRMYKSSILSSGGLDQNIFKGYKRVLSGHYHHHSTIGNITYLGSLFYLNWEDAFDWRGFSVYDVEKDTYEKVENELSLFSVLNYEEAKDLSDKELIDSCKDFFVRLDVEEEYEKIDLKELVHKINKSGPISLEIKDKTIISDSKVDSSSDNELQKGKTLTEYAENRLKGNKDKLLILERFEKIYNEAIANKQDVI